MSRKTAFRALVSAGLFVALLQASKAMIFARGEDPVGHDLTLVYTINNVGYIDVCGCKKKKVRQGSVTRRASLFNQFRERGKQLLIVDGGNTLFNDREDRRAKPHERPQLIAKAKVLVESYNRMGYRAMAVSHGEFCLGFDTLRELQKMAKFPFLSANLVSDKEGEEDPLVFDPFAEIEINGTKVGILGLSLVTIPKEYLDKDAPGQDLRVRDAIDAAKKYVPELRARNDLVVVLSQNDVDYNRRLVDEVPGIDILIDPLIKLGTYTKWIREEEELRYQLKDSHVFRCDAQGARVGMLDLTVFPQGRPLLDREAIPELPKNRSNFAFERVGVDPHILEDPSISLLVSKFKSSTQFVETEHLPALANKEKYHTATTCSACHVEQHEWWLKTAHAHAFASLEETNDQWRQDCIGCHTLGYGQAFFLPKEADPYKNVQCESCHGLNPEHPQDPANHKWPRIEEKTCLNCHNEDQTRSKFQYFSAKRKMTCPKMQP